MKFTAVLALVAAATVVSAETNAQRMARGLPPKAPAKRGTPVWMARRGSPSGSPNPCNSGSLHCCSSTGTTTNNDEISSLVNSLGINVGSATQLGANCSPITALGTGGNSCTQQTACCSNNSYNGLINVGCTPISVNA